MTIVAYASAQSAAKFPAGVDPNKCPNFPICDNAALHNQAPANQWNAQYQQPQPQWNQWNPQPAAPQWNAQPQISQWNPQPAAPQWNANYQQPAHSQSGGDKFPAGVSPESCPNYPYCEVNAGSGHHAARAAPLQGFTERLYPAGVSPQSCPNYPEC